MKSPTNDGCQQSLGFLLKGLGILVFLLAACLAVCATMIFGASLYFDYTDYLRDLRSLLEIGVCFLVAGGGVWILRVGGRKLGDKSNKGAIAGVSLAVLAFTLLVYLYVFPIIMLGEGISNAVAKGGQYLDSLTPGDIQVWIDRSKKLMAQHKAGQFPEGYISKKNLPQDLSKLNITGVDVGSDRIDYVWVGGLDHTELDVEQKDDGTFQVTAVYNDESSKVIWPKP